MRKILMLLCLLSMLPFVLGESNLSVSSPQSVFYNNTNISLVPLVQNGTQVNCFYNLNQLLNISADCFSNSSILGSEGLNLFMFYANESASLNWTNINFTVDTTIPQIDFASNSVLNNTYFNTSQRIFVNVSVTETNLNTSFMCTPNVLGKSWMIWDRENISISTFFNRTNYNLGDKIGTTINGIWQYASWNGVSWIGSVLQNLTYGNDYFVTGNIPFENVYSVKGSITTSNLIQYPLYIVSNSSTTFEGYMDNFKATYPSSFLYNFSSCDLANNCNHTSTRTINIDTILPQIDFASTSSENNTFLNTTQRFFLNISVNETNLNTSVVMATSTNGAWFIWDRENISVSVFFNRTDYPVGAKFGKIVNGTWKYRAWNGASWIGTGFLNLTRGEDYYVNPGNILAENVYAIKGTLAISNISNLFLYILSNSSTTFEGYMDNFKAAYPTFIFYNFTVCDIVNNCANTPTRITIFDILNPIINVGVGTTAGLTTISISHTEQDPYLNTTSCKFSIYDIRNQIDSGNLNQSVSCNADFTNQTSGFGYFRAIFYAKDLAGNEGSQEYGFIVPQRASTEGGGSNIVTVVGGGAANFSMLTSSGSNSYLWRMGPDNTRIDSLLFRNNGEDQITLHLSVEGNITDLVIFENTTVMLPVSKDFVNEVLFTVKTPSNLPKGTYTGNIVAIDGAGNRRTISLTVEVDSLFIFNKLSASTNVNGLQIPYFLISFVSAIVFGLIVLFITNRASTSSSLYKSKALLVLGSSLFAFVFSLILF